MVRHHGAEDNTLGQTIVKLTAGVSKKHKRPQDPCAALARSQTQTLTYWLPTPGLRVAGDRPTGGAHGWLKSAAGASCRQRTALPEEIRIRPRCQIQAALGKVQTADPLGVRVF